MNGTKKLTNDVLKRFETVKKHGSIYKKPKEDKELKIKPAPDYLKMSLNEISW